MAKRGSSTQALETIWGLFQRSRKVSTSQVRKGQTAEQIRLMLGNPLSVDTKLTKTKKREIWKYNRRGSNRYDLRITLDDGFVVGWDSRNS